MTDRTFVPFTETNEWEGETWTFWLQVEGNEAELLRLAEIVEIDHEAFDFDTAFVDIPEDRLSERDVDLIVAWCGDGYYSEHSKVTGTLRITDSTTVTDLYKGGVMELFS